MAINNVVPTQFSYAGNLLLHDKIILINPTCFWLHLWEKKSTSRKDKMIGLNRPCQYCSSVASIYSGVE